jgi:hypothetical protein
MFPRRLHIGLAFLAACLLPLLTAQAADPPQPPLTLTPQNTVILDGGHYAGRYLQYYLMRCVARAPDADKYAPHNSKIDRAAAGAFAMYPASRAGEIPRDKCIIALGRTSYLNEADQKRLKAVPGSVLLQRQGNVLVVANDTPGDPRAGEFAAIDQFFNRCADVRLYAPDALWWHLSPEPQIVIGDLDRLIRPALAKATWSGAWWPDYPKDWDLMNQSVTEGSQLRANHTLITYFNPDKYYKDHPDIYEMKNGARPRPTGTAWNPCLSAPELPDIAMAEIRQRMKKNPNTTYLSFGVMDTHFACDCPACQASVKAHNGSYSNLYYHFMNEVARRVAKEYPHLYLTTYVYSNVARPPEGMRIEPNIVLDTVFKSYNWVDPVEAANDKAEIMKWADLGAGWVAHDWSFSGVSPREYTRSYAAVLQWGRQHGIKGIYTEWTQDGPWPLDGARYWIMRQLQSNPSQDVNALWKQYCDDMYGPASETMYQLFLTFAQKYTYSNNTIERMDAPRQEMAMYTPADLAYQQHLLDEARRLSADSPTVQKRLAEFERYYRANALFAQAVGEPVRLFHQFNGEGINKAALAFYARDNGDKLKEAIAYYRSLHPAVPGAKSVDITLGMFASYVNNYSMALGQALGAITNQAIKATDPSESAQQAADQFKAKANALLQANLPKGAPPQNRLQGMLDQAIALPTTDQMPTIDGKLDDPAWQQAAPLDGFLSVGLLRPSENKTTGKVMRVGDHLLIALTCNQKGPIWASTPPAVKTGTRIWRESGVEVFFGPPPESSGKTPYAQYVLNALGAYRGFAAAADQRQGVQVAAHQDQGVFTIEASLPLKTDRYDYSKFPVLSFNAMRDVYVADTYTADEIIGWHPVFVSGTYPESRGLLFTNP